MIAIRRSCSHENVEPQEPSSNHSSDRQRPPICGTIVYQNGGLNSCSKCITMVVSGVRNAVAGCGHQWREERKRHSILRLSITLAPPTQTACRGTSSPLTTIVIHSRQVCNHHFDTLPCGTMGQRKFATAPQRATCVARSGRSLWCGRCPPEASALRRRCASQAGRRRVDWIRCGWWELSGPPS